MKKALSLLLALVTCLSLCACKPPQSSLDPTATSTTVDSDSKIPNADNNNETNGTPSDDNNGNASEDVQLDIVEGTVFNEGKAFVTLRNEMGGAASGIVAIDTTGNILFELDEKHHLSTTFYNNLALVGLKNGEYSMYDVLCDVNGNIYKPEDFGGTSYFPSLDDSLSVKLLSDGYIIISNEDNSTAGILSTNFEWILPMSNDLYDTLTSLYNFDLYYNGYLIDYDRYFKLRSGTWSNDFSTIEVRKASDLYRLDNNGVVTDIRTKNESFTIPNTKALLSNSGSFPFVDGYALLTDLESKNNKFTMRYYVVDDTGDFVIEPTYKDSILAGSQDNSVILCDNTLIFSYATMQKFYSTAETKDIAIFTKFEVYDLSGNKLGSYEIEVPQSTVSNKYYIMATHVNANDGIIAINYTIYDYHVEYDYLTSNTSTLYFTKDLTPLFGHK